jgi:trimethylamine:corrinoid methyltransferase-like protein
MAEVWQPAIIDRRSSWNDWVAKGRPAPRDRARKKARQFLFPHDHRPVQRKERRWRRARSVTTQSLSSYEPEPLACADRIGEIIAAYEKM